MAATDDEPSGSTALFNAAPDHAPKPELTLCHEACTVLFAITVKNHIVLTALMPIGGYFGRVIGLGKGFNR